MAIVLCEYDYYLLDYYIIVRALSVGLQREHAMLNLYKAWKHKTTDPHITWSKGSVSTVF